jgi:iron complex outermembrane receptor protein
VAIPVTALNDEMIEQRFSRDLLDLGSIAPNLIVDPILGNGTAAISIRGIQLNDVEKSFDPPVGVFLDGVYLASTTGALLTVYDAQTIEVLRGPQGTLFGRNTIGGLMHIQRNRPTGEWGGKFSATYGRYEQLDFKGVVNLPGMFDNTFKSKLAFVRLGGGGYFRNVTRDRREGDNDLIMISPQLQWDPNENLSLNLAYDYIRDRTPTRLQCPRPAHGPLRGHRPDRRRLADAHHGRRAAAPLRRRAGARCPAAPAASRGHGRADRPATGRCSRECDSRTS